jgi:hypothetical protein
MHTSWFVAENSPMTMPDKANGSPFDGESTILSDVHLGPFTLKLESLDELYPDDVFQ